MSSRPLKSIGAGKLQEFTLSEENYLAYQSGLHLAGMDSSDCSALTRVDLGGNTVGTFTNTFFDDSSTTSPLTLSSTLSVSMVSTSGTNTHTNTISGGGLPETIYVDDIIEINVQGTTSSNDGSTFESISYSVATSGTAGFTSTISGTPTPTIINDEETVWQDNASGLSGSYDATFRYTIESTGSLNIVINSNSIDNDNSNASASDQLVLNTIEVQPARPPATIEQETDLFQNTEAVSPIQNEGALKKNPVYWRKTNGSGIKEMSDTELDVLAERLIRTIVNNEMPGVFRLQDGQPDSTYVKFLENIFADTRQDGSTNYYHIWMKQSGTSPAKLNPISILRQNSLFAGIREMTDAEMQFTFGERIKKVIMDTGIGTYQLRSSSQGAPTALGTWVARGTALDTRKTFLDDPGYTSALNYEKDYTGEYVPTYETSYSSEYILDYTSQYSSDYSATFQGLYISEYTGDYTGEYNTEFAENYIDIYSGSYIDEIYTGDFTLGYTGDYETIDESEIYGTSFEGTPYSTEFVAVFVEDFYTGDYISIYTSEYVSDYASDYSSAYDGAEYVSSYEDIYTGDYSSEYAAGFSSIYSEEIYTGNYQEDYLTEYSSDYETLYNTVYVGNYERIDSELYTGDYTGEVVEDYTGDYEREIPETFTGDYERDSLEEYVGNYISADSAVYTGDYERIETADYTGDYTGEIDEVYTGSYESDVQENYTGEYQRLDPETYTGNYEFDVLENYSTGYGGEVTEDYTGDYSGFYATDYTGSYDTFYSGSYSPTYVSAYEYDYVSIYLVSAEENYTGDYQTDYLTGYTHTYDTDYGGDYTIDYSSEEEESYTGSYDGIVDVPYLATYDSSYTEDTNYLATYITEYIETLNYTATYATDYETAYATDYSEIIAEDYTGTYVGTVDVPYTSSYITDFSTTYVGTYVSTYEALIDYQLIQNTYVGSVGSYIGTEPYTGGDYIAESYLNETLQGGGIGGGFYTGVGGSYDSHYYDVSYSGSEAAYDGDTTFIVDLPSSYTGTFSVNYSSEGSYITFYEGDYLLEEDFLLDAFYEGIASYDSEYEERILYEASTYQGDYVETSIYEGNYEATFISNIVDRYLVPYTGTFSVGYLSGVTDYIVFYETDYTGDYLEENIYTGDYSSSYLGPTPYATIFAAQSAYAGDDVGYEQGDYEGAYVDTYIQLYAGVPYTGANYDSYVGTYNSYSATFVAGEPYVAAFAGIPYTGATVVETYEGELSPGEPEFYDGGYSGTFVGLEPYESSYAGVPYTGTNYDSYEGAVYLSYDATFVGLEPYTREYSNEYVSVSPEGYENLYISDYQPTEQYLGNYGVAAPTNYVSAYEGPKIYNNFQSGVYAQQYETTLTFEGGGTETAYSGPSEYPYTAEEAAFIVNFGAPYLTGSFVDNTLSTYDAYEGDEGDILASYAGPTANYTGPTAGYAGNIGSVFQSGFFTGATGTYAHVIDEYVVQNYTGLAPGVDYAGFAGKYYYADFAAGESIYVGPESWFEGYQAISGFIGDLNNGVNTSFNLSYDSEADVQIYSGDVIITNYGDYLGSAEEGNYIQGGVLEAYTGANATFVSYTGLAFYESPVDGFIGIPDSEFVNVFIGGLGPERTYQSDISYNVEYVETYTGPTSLNYAGYTGVGGPDSTYYAQFLRSGPVFAGGGADAASFIGGTYIQGEPDYYQGPPTNVYVGASVNFAGYTGNQFATPITAAGYYANFEGPVYIGAVLNFAGYTGPHSSFLGSVEYTGPTFYTGDFLVQYLATSVSYDGFLDNTETYGGFEGAETGQYVGVNYDGPEDGYVGPIYISDSTIIQAYTSIDGEGVLQSYETGTDFPALIEQEEVDYLSAVTSNYDTTSIYAGVNYEPNYVAISYAQTNFNSYTGPVVRYESDITDFAGDYLADYLTAANYLSGADINYVSEYVVDESTNYEGVVDQEIYTGDDLNYSEDYTGNYETDTTYTGDYTADYVVEVGYTTDYSADDDVAQYLTSSTYIGDYSVLYQVIESYEVEFIGAYQSTVFATYEGGQKFTGPTSIIFEGDEQYVSIPSYTGPSGTYEHVPSNYDAGTTNYGGYVSSLYEGSSYEGGLTFAGYSGPGLNYEGNEIANYDVIEDYIEIYGGDYTGPPSYDGTSYTAAAAAFEASFNSDVITQGEESVYESPALVYVATEEIPQEETYTGDYEGNYETDYLTDYEAVDETENYASDGSGYESVDETIENSYESAPSYTPDTLTVANSGITLSSDWDEPLGIAANGLSIRLGTNASWASYRNLETTSSSIGVDLRGLVTTQEINTSDALDITFTYSTTVYLIRQTDWNAVDLTGWTSLGSAGSILTDNSTVEYVYQKSFSAGTHTFDNNSAMYMFDPSELTDFVGATETYLSGASDANYLGDSETSYDSGYDGAVDYVAAEGGIVEETYTGNYETIYSTSYTGEYEDNYQETTTYGSYESELQYITNYETISEEIYSGDYEFGYESEYAIEYESGYSPLGIFSITDVYSHPFEGPQSFEGVGGETDYSGPDEFPYTAENTINVLSFVGDTTGGFADNTLASYNTYEGDPSYTGETGYEAGSQNVSFAGYQGPERYTGEGGDFTPYSSMFKTYTGETSYGSNLVNYVGPFEYVGPTTQNFDGYTGSREVTYHTFYADDYHRGFDSTRFVGQTPDAFETDAGYLGDTPYTGPTSYDAGVDQKFFIGGIFTGHTGTYAHDINDYIEERYLGAWPGVDYAGFAGKLYYADFATGEINYAGTTVSFDDAGVGPNFTGDLNDGIETSFDQSYSNEAEISIYTGDGETNYGDYLSATEISYIQAFLAQPDYDATSVLNYAADLTYQASYVQGIAYTGPAASFLRGIYYVGGPDYIAEVPYNSSNYSGLSYYDGSEGVDGRNRNNSLNDQYDSAFVGDLGPLVDYQGEVSFTESAYVQDYTGPTEADFGGYTGTASYVARYYAQYLGDRILFEGSGTYQGPHDLDGLDTPYFVRDEQNFEMESYNQVFQGVPQSDYVANANFDGDQIDYAGYEVAAGLQNQNTVYTGPSGYYAGMTTYNLDQYTGTAAFAGLVTANADITYANYEGQLNYVLDEYTGPLTRNITRVSNSGITQGNGWVLPLQKLTDNGTVYRYGYVSLSNIGNLGGIETATGVDQDDIITALEVDTGWCDITFASATTVYMIQLDYPYTQQDKTGWTDLGSVSSIFNGSKNVWEKSFAAGSTLLNTNGVVYMFYPSALTFYAESTFEQNYVATANFANSYAGYEAPLLFTGPVSNYVGPSIYSEGYAADYLAEAPTLYDGFHSNTGVFGLGAPDSVAYTGNQFNQYSNNVPHLYEGLDVTFSGATSYSAWANYTGNYVGHYLGTDPVEFLSYTSEAYGSPNFETALYQDTSASFQGGYEGSQGDGQYEGVNYDGPEDGYIGPVYISDSTIVTTYIGSGSQGYEVGGSGIDSTIDQEEVNYAAATLTNYDSTTNYEGEYELQTEYQDETIISEYVGDYGGISEETYTGDYEGAEAEVYTGNYESDFETFYTGTYLTDAEELYTGEYEGVISEDYTGDYASIVEENYTGSYERSDPDSYTGDYIGEIPEEYVSEYGSEQTEPFTGNYIGIIEESYTGEYQSVIEETYTGDYERTDEEIYTGEYTGEVLEDYSTDYATDYVSSYEDIYTGDYEGDYEQDFTGDYGSEYTSDYSSDYATDYDSGYTGTYTSVYTGDYSGNYESEYESIYESEFIQDYTGEFVVEYVPDYTVRYGTEYSTSYEGDSFTLLYESDYIANEYEGDYETTFIPYSGFYEATSPETYSGGVDLEFYIGDYTGQDYTGDYEATFTGPIYIGDYIDEYEGESQPENYIGSYEGTTVYGEETELVGTPTVIETYTLYVRID